MELKLAVPETWSIAHAGVPSERGWTTYVSPGRSFEVVLAPLIGREFHDAFPARHDDRFKRRRRCRRLCNCRHGRQQRKHNNREYIRHDRTPMHL